MEEVVMKKFPAVVTFAVLLALLLALVPSAALAQEEVTCESDAIVQGEDSLSTLAEKYYGNILAYPVIVDATNAKAATDSSYAKIDDPNVIELGWKLCIPPGEVAQNLLNESVFTQVSQDAAAKTLVVALTEDSVTMDPSRVYEFHAITVLRSVYETLIDFPPGRQDQLVPRLAENWTISDDGLVYTFTIAQGHVFSTGRPVTAEDVAFSLRRIKNLKGTPAFLAAAIAKVEATDPSTVVMTLSEPDPAILSKLVSDYFGVMDSAEAKAHGATDAEDADQTDTAEEWLNNNSIGSGPYMLQCWVPRVEAILVRNPQYPGQPGAFERVIYRTVSEAAAQKLALEAGDLDIGLDVSADQIPSFKENSNLAVYEGLSPSVFFLIMNMDPAIGGPMAQDAVQDAIRLAVDYDGIKQLVGGSAATPVNIMPVDWAYALDPAKAITRNVDAAKAKLAEAGFANDLTVDLEYPEYTSGGVSIPTLAQKIQADLAEADITVNLVPGDIGPALQKYRDGKAAFGLWLWGPDFVDPIDRLAFTPGGVVGLRVNWTEDKASAALNDAVKRAKVVTADADRAAAFTDIQNIMLDENPFVFLVQSGTQVAYNANIKGFVYLGTTAGRVDPYLMSK
jgi:peptide/nickel transport system substrate-binding protein